MTLRARFWRWTVAAVLLLVALPSEGQVPAYRVVTWSATDSFSELRLDQFGVAYYVRTTGGVRVVEKEETELARVGDPAPWNAALTLTFVQPGSARFGRVLCLGTVTGPGISTSNDQFSFIAGGLGATAVTQEGTTPAPGTEAGVTFLGPSFGSVRMWAADRMSMMAELNGPGIVSTLGDPARNSSGIWAGPPSAPTLVARVGDPAPGFSGGDVLHQILADDGGGTHMAPVQGGGSVALLSAVLLAGGGTTRALYRHDSVGGLALVVANGDPIPGGGTFDTLDAPTLSRTGALVFSDVAGIYSTASGSPAVVAKRFGAAPGGGLFSALYYPAVAGWALAFKGETTTVPSRHVFLETGDAPLAALVSQNDPAPGTTGSFERFRTNAIVNSCGEVAFLAELNQTGGVTAANDEGIWLFDAHGAGVLIAREGDPADALGFPLVTISTVHLFDDGATNAHSGLDDGGVAVFNDSSELLFSVELSDGSEAVVVAYLGPQCEVVFANGFEEGDVSGWSFSVP